MVKWKVYKTIVKPAMVYAAETWARSKHNMWRKWMSGVTKLDSIRNERIRGIAKMGEISKKVQESSLKLYGHVLRRNEYYVGKRVMVKEVPGKRMRGRPKRKCLDNMMWDENKCIVLYVYVGAISRRLVSNEDVPLRVRDHAWRATTDTRRQNSAAQAVVRHGKPASGVNEFGDSY